MLSKILLVVTIAVVWRFFSSSRKQGHNHTGAKLEQRGLCSWPAVEGRLWGNLDILYNALRTVKGRLPGAAMESLAKQ